MKPRGACFPSPILAADDEELERFIRAPAPHNPWPELVATAQPNPLWRAEELTQGWSQPFVRTRYAPTTSPIQAYILGETGRRTMLTSLPLLIIEEHERLHGLLDFTPAKEWARVCLALAHEHADALLDPREGVERGRLAGIDESTPWGPKQAERWVLLQRANAALNQIVSQIALAEELLVTTFSIARLESRLREMNKEALSDLEKEEDKVVIRQAMALQHVLGDGSSDADQAVANFRPFYDAFKQVARIVCREDSFATLARLAIFLEPLDFEGLSGLDPVLTADPDMVDAFVPRIQADDATQRCRRLVEFVETGRVATCRGLMAWLLEEEIAAAKQRAQGSGYTDHQVWEVALHFSSGLLETHPAMQHLWWVGSGRTVIDDLDQLIQGGATLFPEAFDRQVQWVYRKWRDPAATKQQETVLYPFEAPPRSNQWFIGHWIVGKDFEASLEMIQRLSAGSLHADEVARLRSRVRIEEVFHPAFLEEAIRQQLVQGVGIKCPYYDPWRVQEGGCTCDQWRRRQMRRLARWAGEGRFGDDEWTEWTDLPVACQRRERWE